MRDFETWVNTLLISTQASTRRQVPALAADDDLHGGDGGAVDETNHSPHLTMAPNQKVQLQSTFDRVGDVG